MTAEPPPPAYGEPLPSMSTYGGAATWHPPDDDDTDPPTREGMMTDWTPSTLTYPVADFDGGASCDECGRDLPPGTPYDTRVLFMAECGTPVATVVCVYCPADRP